MSDEENEVKGGEEVEEEDEDKEITDLSDRCVEEEQTLVGQGVAGRSVTAPRY